MFFRSLISPRVVRLTQLTSERLLIFLQFLVQRLSHVTRLFPGPLRGDHLRLGFDFRRPRAIGLGVQRHQSL